MYPVMKNRCTYNGVHCDDTILLINYLGFYFATHTFVFLNENCCILDQIDGLFDAVTYACTAYA